jgi:hypothetical protein
MAQVFHAVDPTFGWGDEDPKWPDEYSLVATVDSDDVDKVYELTNTIDSYWWKNAGVTPEFIGEGCRSTSVGDVIKMTDNKLFRCESIGWKEL